MWEDFHIQLPVDHIKPKKIGTIVDPSNQGAAFEN